MEALHKFRNVLNKIVETICIVLSAHDGSGWNLSDRNKIYL